METQSVVQQRNVYKKYGRANSC